MIMTSRKRPMFPPRPDRRPIRFRPGGRRARTFGRGGKKKLIKNDSTCQARLRERPLCCKSISLSAWAGRHVSTWGTMQIDTVSVCSMTAVWTKRPQGGSVEEILRAVALRTVGPSTSTGNPHRYRVVGRAACCPFPIPPRLPLPQQHLISSSEPLDQLWTGSMYTAR